MRWRSVSSAKRAARRARTSCSAVSTQPAGPSDTPAAIHCGRRAPQASIVVRSRGLDARHCRSVRYGPRGRRTCPLSNHRPRRPLMSITRLLLAAVLAFAFAPSTAAAQTKVKFVLDWQIQGPQAPFITARATGAFTGQGLDVAIDRGTGSQKTIEQVATGTYDMGYGDINSMIEYNAKNPQNPLVAVGIILNSPPFSLLSLKRYGIQQPKDLKGIAIGAPGRRRAAAALADLRQERGRGRRWRVLDQHGAAAARAGPGEGRREGHLRLLLHGLPEPHREPQDPRERGRGLPLQRLRDRPLRQRRDRPRRLAQGQRGRPCASS